MMESGKAVRVATVKKTGEKFIVQQITFGSPEKVHCWRDLALATWTSAGEVIKTDFEESIIFTRGQVDIADTYLTPRLCEALATQTGLRNGFIVRKSNHKVQPK
jgi:hypothetical protein